MLTPSTQVRLLTYAQLKAIGVSFSREHLWRLEAAGRFPRRVYLSPQKIAWIETEVIAWLEARAAERSGRVYRVHD